MQTKEWRKMQFKNVFSIFFMRRQTKSHKDLPFCSSPLFSISCFLFCTLSVTPLSTRLNRSFGLLVQDILCCVYNFRLELMNFVQIKQQADKSSLRSGVFVAQSSLLSGACNMLQFSAQCCIIRCTLFSLSLISSQPCPFSSC